MWSIADFLLGLLELEYETKSNATIYFCLEKQKAQQKKEANLAKKKTSKMIKKPIKKLDKKLLKPNYIYAHLKTKNKSIS
jgi:hypothetical protein